MRLIKAAIIITLFFIGLNVNAQKIGFIGGLSLSRISVNTPNNNFNQPQIEEKYSFLTGHHIGVVFDIKLSDKAYFEPGFIYTTKGGKYEAKQSGNSNGFIYSASLKQELNLKYFEIPLLFKLRFDFGKIGIYGSFGPYVSMGMAGQQKDEYHYNFNGSIQEAKQSNEIDWRWKKEEPNPYYNNPGLMRLDIGMGYGIGVAYQNLHLRGMYNDGLTNISAVSNVAGYSIKNKGVRISVAYFFGKDKTTSYVEE